MTVVMDGYVRVSRVMGRQGDGYISPTVQREAIQRWADYKGVTIAAWHVDEDQSGGTQERPGLTLAVERAVSGETSGIVSWKIDRFSRYTEGGLRDLRTLEAVGARLAFVQEDIDTSGPMGKFVYTIMLAMAEFFLANVKAAWIEAKTRAHDRGAKIGPTPFGYRRTDGGTLVVHQGEAAIIQTVYELAAAGDIDKATAYLDGLALTHEGGKREGRARNWSTATVRRMLAQRIYFGEMTYERLPPKTFDNLAIVTRGQWEAAQTEARGRKPAADFPLSGIATCAGCGGHLVGTRGGRDGQRGYRCHKSLTAWKGEPCPAPVTTMAHLLEPLVRSYLLDVVGDEYVQSEGSAGLDAAESALLDAERELADFIADTEGAALLRRVGQYESALAARVTAVEDARDLFRTLAQNARQGLSVSPADLLAAEDPEGLAVVARAVLGTLSVRRGRTPLAGRLNLAPFPMPTVTAA